MRSILCGLGAGGMFLAAFLGLGWDFIVSALLAAGLFEGLYLVTKPKKITGKIPLDMRPDGAYLKKRLEEAREDFESIRSSMEKIQDRGCGKNLENFIIHLQKYWPIWKKIRIRSLWQGGL